MECGALDGETRSNTLWFEKQRKWSGLLIEAGPVNYQRLVKKNRKAYSSPACLGVTNYPTVVGTILICSTQCDNSNTPLINAIKF